jgi:predicted nucleotidyltransferase component of viral defense system
MNMSIKPLPTRNLALLAERYEIPPAFLEKDWYTQHILGIMAECRSDRFQLVFGGGTSLSKGYQLIKRFSEDIDFKVQMLQPNTSRTNRRDYGERLLEAILESSPELELAGEVTKHDRSLFIKFDISYPSQYSLENALRTCIQVEVSFKEPTLAPEPRSLTSLIAQMQEQAPEIGEFPCVSLAETGADKVASLTWRVFAKAPNDPGYDQRNIRHLYDLAYLSPQIADREDWASLSIRSLETDLETRAKSMNSSSRELLAGLVPRLTNEPEYRQHYEDFVQALSYEERPMGFGEAIDQLSMLTEKLLERPVVKVAGTDRGSDEQR